MPTTDEVMERLSRVKDPELGRNIVEMNMIRDLQINKTGKIEFTLALTIPGCPLKDQMEREAREALLALPGVTDVKIKLSNMSDEERHKVLGNTQVPLPRLSQFNRVNKVVAVMSGKGGVGKSSISAILAATLARRGLKVGILDADITGPSIPKLFGLASGGLRGSEQGILPAVTDQGIKIISTNLLVPDENAAVIWRGPMISGTIKQFWTDVLWGILDVLLIDLPPGTSDAALTVMQSLPVDEVVLVSTPQELAGMVVRKADSMLKQLNKPVLAVVENMSYFTCPDCGKPHEIFGPSHVQELANSVGADLFVRLPIDRGWRQLGDAGKIWEFEAEELAPLLDQLVQ